MTGKQTLIALSVALALGVVGASMAQASDNNSGGYHGGSKIGPLGQRFATRGPTFSFAYWPRWYRYGHRHGYNY